MENWKKKTGADLVRVPFKGGGDTVTNMLSGVTPVGFLGLGNFLSYIRAGQVTPLLVDADKRVEFIPEVATLGEMGFARDHTRAFFGMLAPAGTPKAITERVRKEIIAIANEPAFMQRHFIDRGLEPASTRRSNTATTSCPTACGRSTSFGNRGCSRSRRG